MLKCTNSQCMNDDIKKGNKCTFFAYLPLRKQLKDLLENHNVCSYLITQENRVKKNANNLEDIFDGSLYKSAMNACDGSSLSLTFNSDGVPVFKSSACSIWPLLCTVNELPPHMRREHVLLCALWFGVSKPNMNEFLKPFVYEVRMLNETGFVWTNPIDHCNTCTRVKALIGVCDSVARPALQSSTQYNGEYGCSFCLDAGIYVKQGNGHTRAYPFTEDSILRTPQQHIHLAEQAVSSQCSVLGVKGPSILSLLPNFNIIQGLVPDYMHSIMLGVVRQMATLWFDSANNSEPFYIEPANQKLIDLLLLSIRPPCNISRTPRSLSLRKFWKAHEWYSWTCYYSLPALQSCLAKKFFVHWALLVECITILLNDSIPPLLVEHCDACFKKFVTDFEVLYGLRNVSFNVHLCLHLTQSVRAWGPLWTQSAFLYESFNGNLLSLIKGTQRVPLQICKSYLLQRSMPLLSASVTSSVDCSNSYKGVLDSFMSGNIARLKNSLTVDGVSFLGRSKRRPLSDAHLLAIHYAASYVPPKTIVQYFDRAVVLGEIVHSANYCRSLKRNSFTVALVDGKLFAIEHFIAANVGNGTEAFALGRHFERDVRLQICRHPSIGLQLSHIASVSKVRGALIAIKVQTIARKCIFIGLKNKRADIICKQVNVFEYCA